MKPFEAYQLEELEQTRRLLDQAWGQKNSHAIQRTVVVGEDKRAGTFYGLTHDTDSVCAVVQLFGEPYFRLVHFSQVGPFPTTTTTSEPNLDENKCAKNHDEDGGFGRKG